MLSLLFFLMLIGNGNLAMFIAAISFITSIGFGGNAVANGGLNYNRQAIAGLFGLVMLLISAAITVFV